MPALEPYPARNGAPLYFRRYRANSDTHLILLHGSSAHGAYLHAFAGYLSARNSANVYTPDLRGHGFHPQRRGDIDYIGQLEDDLADLIAYLRSESARNARFFVGGHSSGGGLALRFGGSRHGHLAQGILLLAPYLGYGAPMIKKGAGGWASPNLPRIAGLALLDGLGIKALHAATVLQFKLPEQYRNGYETLRYSFRMMKGMHPDDYRLSLQRCQVPMLLLVGSDDEAFHADGFKTGILPYKADARIGFVDGGSHLGIIMSAAAMAETARWLAST